MKLNQFEKRQVDSLFYEISKPEVLEFLEDGWALSESVRLCGLDNKAYAYFYNMLRKQNHKFKRNHKNNGKYKSNKIGFNKKYIIKNSELENIKRYYYDLNFSLEKISKKYNTSAATVLGFMKRHNLERRTNSEAQQIKIKNDPDYHNKMVAAGVKSYETRRKIRTLLEEKFASFCELNDIKYEEQWRKIGNKHPYDFFLPEYNLLVEMDGYYWHEMPEQIEKDKKQEEEAISKGYNIIRISSRQLNRKSKKISTIINKYMEVMYGRPFHFVG